MENPWLYYETNTVGTLNLLEISREIGIRKFVLASTSSVYGVQPQQPFTEDMHTDRPLSPYAASKRAAEVLAYTYHDLYDIDVTVFRYFTVYGPAGRPDMSVFRFIRWVAEGLPVKLLVLLDSCACMIVRLEKLLRAVLVEALIWQYFVWITLILGILLRAKLMRTRLPISTSLLG